MASCAAAKSLYAARSADRHLVRCFVAQARSASTTSGTNNPHSTSTDKAQPEQAKSKAEDKRKLTMAEQDEELRRKLEGISGDGGEAGLELENGQPVAMKRSVKENMFRLI